MSLTNTDAQSISLPEINTRLLRSIFVHPAISVSSLIPVQLSNLAPGVEGGDEARVLVAGPVLDGEHQGVLGELLGGAGEGQVSVKAEPGVIEPETHEGKEEVDLLVDLGDGVPNVLLIVTDVVPAPALVIEGVQLGLSDGLQPVGSDDILWQTTVEGILVDRRSIAVSPWV